MGQLASVSKFFGYAGASMLQILVKNVACLYLTTYYGAGVRKYPCLPWQTLLLTCTPTSTRHLLDVFRVCILLAAKTSD